MTILPSPIPHPLDLSPWDVPGWVYDGLEWAIGVEWPEGNEAAVWDLADQWFSVAAALTGPRDDALAAAGEVLGGYGGTGMVGAAFDEAWRKVAAGDDAPLFLVLTIAHDLGKLVEECGCDIEAAKIEVWIEVGLLIVELLALAVAVALTMGAASPAAAAAITATRFAIQRIFKRLVAQLAKKALKEGVKEAADRAVKEVSERGLTKVALRAGREGLEEAAEEVAVDLATQTYQNTTGRRDGVDVASLGTSAVGGFAGGAAASLAGLGSHASGKGLRFGENVGREMGGEALAEMAAGLATGGGLPGLDDVARAATSAAGSSVTTQSTHLLNARNLDARSPALSQAPILDEPLTPAAYPGAGADATPVGPADVSSTAVSGSPRDEVDLASVGVAPDPVRPAAPVTGDGGAGPVGTAIATGPAGPTAVVPVGDPEPAMTSVSNPTALASGASAASPGPAISSTSPVVSAVAAPAPGTVPTGSSPAVSPPTPGASPADPMTDGPTAAAAPSTAPSTAPAVAGPATAAHTPPAAAPASLGEGTAAAPAVPPTAAPPTAAPPTAAPLTAAPPTAASAAPPAPAPAHASPVGGTLPPSANAVQATPAPRAVVAPHGAAPTAPSTNQAVAGTSTVVGTTPGAPAVFSWRPGEGDRRTRPLSPPSASHPGPEGPDALPHSHVAVGDVRGGGSGPDLGLSDGSGAAGGAPVGPPHFSSSADMLRNPTPEDLAALGVGQATYADLGLDPSTLKPAEVERYSVALSRTALINPRDIRFTQRSVSPQTSDGITAVDLAEAMRAGGWRGGPLHGVRWGDGSFSSLDNRRLRAARQAGLPRVPFVVHAPSDRLADWQHEWTPERQRRNALRVEIRELPDGQWVIGGDEGRVVYAKGTVPQTYGDIALFRAAEQRSLLPGHLFGADREPVLLARPPDPLRGVELNEAEQQILDDLRLRATATADMVEADLADVGRAVAAELDLASSIALRGQDNRVKSADSLARKYHDQARIKSKDVATFAGEVNDVLRFSLVLPGGDQYRPALERVLATLEQHRYRVDPASRKNFWKPGNRYYGFNCTITAPGGQRFELQLPTEASWRAGKLTHQPYEILRREDELAPRRVHALMQMLAVNKRLSMVDQTPEDLGPVAHAKDASFSKWISDNGGVWRAYRAWLDFNGRSFAAIVAEFGLDTADFPVSDHVADQLGEEDVHLLLDLPGRQTDRSRRSLRD